jgi:hypothetical protein
MSTVGEIEAAIDRLPAAEQCRVRDWLSSRLLPAESMRAKTGAELAKTWSAGFHLTPTEADEFAADLDALRARQAPPKAPAWE